MMPAMRIVTALLALAALTCASQPQGPTCINLSGSYTLAEQPLRKGTGSAAFVFGEGASLVKVESLTIAQPGCRIELKVRGDGGKSYDAVLENDLDWTEDGVSATWSSQKSGSGILAGASSRTRTLSMRLSAERDKLTLSSEFDERGLALLFMPFHDHGAATCVMKRVPEAQAANPVSR
ncbi:MAG: hypothetical protein QOC81_2475 [Thermoanaerobaculia bacterium]|jgi:hypothetical protein|nr:hypothetical protein [Thermoanaerobaculia bacterium]